MSVPGTAYAYSRKGVALYWDSIKPPPGWIWCPRSSTDERSHYKPDDGARCLWCGFEPKQHEPAQPQLRIIPDD